MSKKFESTERFMRPDTKYQSMLASKFINNLMLDGKKSTAERIFYKALAIVAEKVSGQEPIEVFEAALNNIKPEVEVRSKRVGGATYQVPVPVTPKRRLSLAIRWVLASIRKRKGKPLHEFLATEIIAAYNREGAAITIRENVHKMAEANKAFAHFAW